VVESSATLYLPDLTPVAAEAGAAEGDPRWVYTCPAQPGQQALVLCSYTPTGGGAPRLVAHTRVGAQDQCLSVWDTGSGAFLRALRGPDPRQGFVSLVTYQRPSDGRPRVIAGGDSGQLCVFDGDDFTILHTTPTDSKRYGIGRLAVYEGPVEGGTRLVTG
jgi:WD40 repeat protein